MQQVIFEDWGKIEYGTAWDQQEAILKENLAVKAQWFGKSEEEKDRSIDTTHHFIPVSYTHLDVYKRQEQFMM